MTNKIPIPQPTICISCGEMFKTIFEQDVCQRCMGGTAVPQALEPYVNVYGENAEEFRGRYAEC